MKKKRTVHYSKTPPPGYPTETEWKKIEKELEKSLPSKINLPNNASPVEKTKQELCAHFVRYHLNEKITQRELAKRLDITENRVSEILHYHHDHFTIDRLLDLLSRLKPGIILKVA